MNEIYLLDSDTLIHAYRYDFPPGANHNDFWDWIDRISQKVKINIPQSVFVELGKGNDGLVAFLKKFQHIDSEPEANSAKHLREVLDAYGILTDIDLEIISKRADPHLISHAIDLNGIVVTNEVPNPGITKVRDKKIPDICTPLKVACIRYPRFLWELRSFA